MSSTRIEAIVAAGDAGIRLDRWFQRHKPGVTHGLLSKLLRKGQVRVDGAKCEPSFRLAEGQTITFPPLVDEAQPAPSVRREAAEVITPADAAMIQKAVIYKDDDLIALNKPSGLAVQGGSGIRLSVDGLGPALAFGLAEPPRLVHRLDKDTSGLLVLARHAAAAARLAQGFREKDVEKVYWALVVGVPEKRRGRISLALSKQEQGKTSRMTGERMAPDADDGKPAITEYRVIDTVGRDLAWMELKPVTGRTHQLRVHMVHLGCPIVGDGKYGGSGAFFKGLNLAARLHLHARSLHIDAALLGRPRDLTLTAPLTGHMRDTWKLLEWKESQG